MSTSTSPQRRFNQMLLLPTQSTQQEDIESWRQKQTKYFQPNVSLGPLRVPEYSSLALQRVTVVKESRFIDLGPSGLMLNIITPLQKFSKSGTTLTDVLQQRYRD